MSFQTIIVLLLFIAALVYVGRMLYQNLSAKKGCGENCKCSANLANINPVKNHK